MVMEAKSMAGLKIMNYTLELNIRHNYPLRTLVWLNKKDYGIIIGGSFYFKNGEIVEIKSPYGKKSIVREFHYVELSTMKKLSDQEIDVQKIDLIAIAALEEIR